MGTYTLKSFGKQTDYISKALFDSCIRTGYITKVAASVEAVTA